MKNTEIFQTYDMVVSIPQDTINAQLNTTCQFII